MEPRNSLVRAYYHPIEAAIRWAGLLRYEQHILDVMRSHDKQAPELPNIPQWPLFHRNLSRIYDAIFHDEIPYGKNGITKNDQSLWKDPNLTIRHVDLKTWLCQYYPEEKPRFLFTKYEQFVHPAITIETAQALLIERNAIEIQLRQCQRQYQDLKLQHEAIQRSEVAAADSNNELSHRADLTYQHIIGALLLLLLGKSPSGVPYSTFRTQEAVITALQAHHRGVMGITERTLQSKFAQARRLVTAAA